KPWRVSTKVALSGDLRITEKGRRSHRIAEALLLWRVMSLDRALPARLMIMSAQDARGPYEHEKTRHWSGAAPAKDSVDPAFFALPVRIAEVALQDLAGTRLGERLAADDHGAGHLVATDVLAAHGDDLVGRDGGAGLDDHLGVDHLAEVFVGNAEHRDLEDVGMLEDGILDFGRVDVLAARDDHVLGAVDDEQVAVLVRPGDVA